jgi:hypothetical protein
MEFLKDGKIYKIDKNYFINEENYIKIAWEIINNLKNDSQDNFDKSLRNAYLKYNKEKLNCKYNI